VKLISVRNQQTIYYQAINPATYSGSLSHRQSNSQTILKVTCSRCANCGIPKVYKSYDNKSYK